MGYHDVLAIQWVLFVLHLSLVLVVAYEWRASECEFITPCSIVDIVGSDRTLLFTIAALSVQNPSGQSKWTKISVK